MKSFRPFPQRFLCRALVPVAVASLAMSLAGCGQSADSESPAKSASSKATSSKGGLTLKGDDLLIEAATATAMLGGYSQQPLSVRIMSGWVNTEKAKRANQESNEAEKRKQAMGSFGLMTIQISADQAEPGTYQLVPKAPKVAKGSVSETGTVIIDEDKGAGLAGDYTSQSGTLTIKSVAKNDKGGVTGVEGSFDGKFGSDAGDSRAFSGSFRYAPKD